ncbi:unnamed protein product [Sphagnum balticum]
MDVRTNTSILFRGATGIAAAENVLSTLASFASLKKRTFLAFSRPCCCKQATTAVATTSSTWCLLQLADCRRTCGVRGLTSAQREQQGGTMVRFEAQSKDFVGRSAKCASEEKEGDLETRMKMEENAASTTEAITSASSSSLVMQETLERIRTAGIIACLRSESPEQAVDAGRAALDGGINVLEVTMTTPGASKVIMKLVHEYSSALIGAGTVLTLEEAGIAKEAGARFLLSPVAIQETVTAHSNGHVLFIPGAMTPSEVLTAFNWGAAAVKIYPVSLLGGVQFVRALKKPFPHIPLIASSGIGLDMVESYISAGATAVVVSDSIFMKSAMDKYDYHQIRQQATIAASKCAVAATKVALAGKQGS